MSEPTREEWLQNLVIFLKPHFSDAGYKIPDALRISCGWPATGALSEKKRRIAECWAQTAAADGVPQIFVSPYLVEPLEVAEAVVHELGHAYLDPDMSHGKDFRAFMKAVGLTGKATSTEAGPELKERLEGLLAPLGAYPNSKLDKTKGPVKKQSTRMVKITCSGLGEHDDYILRGSKATLALGVPNCPLCGHDMHLEAEEKPEG